MSRGVDHYAGGHILGQKSQEQFRTLHPLLQVLVLAALESTDISVLEGYRDAELQNKYYNEGKSRVQYPNGKHNHIPSMAVDLAPFIRGRGVSFDHREVCVMAGRILETAAYLGIPVRWGGDWDMDGDAKEHSLSDLVHFELDEERLQRTSWRYFR